MLTGHGSSAIVPFPLHDPTYSLVVTAKAHSLDLAEVLPHRTFSRFLELLDTELQSVRWVRNHSQFIPETLRPKTGVKFCHIGPPPTDDPAIWPHIVPPLRLSLGIVPASTAKFVTHLTLHSDHADTFSDVDVTDWAIKGDPSRWAQRELFLLLQLAQTDRDKAESAVEEQPVERAAAVESRSEVLGDGLLWNILMRIRFALSQARTITIVGATEVPRILGFRRSVTCVELKDCAVRFMGERFPPQRGSPDLAALVLERVRFLTLEEYAESTTPEQFALETIEDVRDIPVRFAHRAASAAADL